MSNRYFSENPPPPIPNLPGYNPLGGTYGRVRKVNWTMNKLKLTDNIFQENQNLRKNSLVYKHGYAIVSDYPTQVRSRGQLSYYFWLCMNEMI